MKTKTSQRRYVKVDFIGYAPIDLAIQIHLLGKECKVNQVGEDMEPYTEYEGEYRLYGLVKEVEE